MGMRFLHTGRSKRYARSPYRARLKEPGKVNDLDTDDQPGFIERQVRRHRAGDTAIATDDVGQEWPVALVFNGISHAVMMCTPRDLEAFAVGFSITEGIVERGSDIHDIEVFFRDDATAATRCRMRKCTLQVVQQAFVALKDKRRALAGSTGCGVCGIESIELLDLQPERVPDTGFLARLARRCHRTRRARTARASAVDEAAPAACTRPRGAMKPARCATRSRTSAGITRSTS